MKRKIYLVIHAYTHKRIPIANAIVYNTYDEAKQAVTDNYLTDTPFQWERGDGDFWTREKPNETLSIQEKSI